VPFPVVVNQTDVQAAVKQEEEVDTGFGASHSSARRSKREMIETLTLPTSEPTLPWRLVWCFGGCWKDENAQRRLELDSFASQVGCSMVCFKKANSSFGRWVQGMPSPLFTVVTDWREAKPCIQTVQMHGQERHLVMMIIVCDTARQVGRAQFFADSLPPEMGPVRVLLNSETEPGKIADYIAQSFGPGRVQVLMEKKRVLQEVMQQQRYEDYCGHADIAADVDAYYSDTSPVNSMASPKRFPSKMFGSISDMGSPKAADRLVAVAGSSGDESSADESLSPRLMAGSSSPYAYPAEICMAQQHLMAKMNDKIAVLHATVESFQGSSTLVNDDAPEFTSCKDMMDNVDTTSSESGGQGFQDTYDGPDEDDIIEIETFLEIPRSAMSNVRMRHKTTGLVFSVRNSFLDFHVPEPPGSTRRAVSLDLLRQGGKRFRRSLTW